MLKKRIMALMLAVVAMLPLQAQSLNDLDIQVVLSQNGDARITETRQMTITDRGTECYIGLGNMGASEVKDLTVSDETGTAFTISNYWGPGLTRENKTHRCGIVKKDNGVTELCWGLGASGERTYITSYTITSLVRAYPDADAIRHVFLDWTVDPKPKHAKVTIMSADPSIAFTPDTCGIWGFRFNGELWFENGKIMAETTEAMNSQAALYIMAKFPKGMMQPTITEDDTFEHKKQLAFEGSDYGDSLESSKREATPLEMVGGLIMGLLGVGMFSYFLFGCHKRDWKKFKNWIRRKRHEQLMNSLDYYREIPLRGDLQRANAMLNTFEHANNPQYQKLLSATVLQLVHLGAFSVEPVMTETGELDKRFIINKRPNVILNYPLSYRMYELFEKAAGENHVLDPNELDTFMKDESHLRDVRTMVNSLRSSSDAKYYDKHQDEVRQVYGFRKFLKDFTLMNERNMTEVKLWKDYMVWATLFGNAEQVIKDMKAINPEFFHMDVLAEQMVDDSIVKAISTSVFTGTNHVLRVIEREEAEISRLTRFSSSSSSDRSSGRGGRSSRGGGGGGFSGGGGGGGIR
ncbi:MAG: DUF2207 domain-containing protein [Prevotella sp.]|jgi:uncharacterized membrane protein YgcG|nr:DUF2207 domain-containing protein [Prevotella sp.]